MNHSVVNKRKRVGTRVIPTQGRVRVSLGYTARLFLKRSNRNETPYSTDNTQKHNARVVEIVHQ